ncbi:MULTISPECIES: fumarylacetoacetase [Marinomonas]|uniref:fumarylacetoacetase n=2 Tax=Marinomonas TaxID=28253 RepID=A0A368ZQM2_9GAMM|nr:MULTISPECIES: fumarylacetoacetase [Marinomonas]MBR7889858.1 fumarylacetoacetase [Marinomonas vulgaris]RCW98299.1 fumarylacetoacetate hydrolase [Marinomonas foliarum]|tara:strand:+ start:8393 stop:9652 length:1260 start_codon:yes stop_codon:yes gene_type:complete
MDKKKTFVPVEKNSDFSIYNLPYGIFSSESLSPRVGVAIGHQVLDLSQLESAGLLPTSNNPVFHNSTLNPFISLGKAVWQQTRTCLQDLLDADNPELRDNQALRTSALIEQASVQMHLPIHVPSYTDFYSSREHAFNVGCMFRGPENALMPNWTELPVGYNGRASSIVVSGTDIVRPSGQIKTPDADRPVFSACRKLDFELETGFIVGRSNALGEPIPVEEAHEHIFGMVLLNDWSARDIQQWEYVPLGPFNSKTFGSSISPWVVTLEALELFRCPAPQQEPLPLPYLREKRDNNYDINLEVAFDVAGEETVISQTNFKYMYWTMAQQLTHHAISGCNMQVGDLLGSGTISGKEKDSRGSLLELTWNMSEPLTLKNGESRNFIEDGDSIVMRGYAQKEDVRVGFGEVRGKVLPAHTFNF